MPRYRATKPATFLIALTAVAGMLAGCTSHPRRSLPPENGLLFRPMLFERGSKFAVYVPRGYSEGLTKRRYPAIVFLHGKGECGTDGQKQAAVGIGPAILLDPDKWNCIVIMPQKPDPEKQWEDYDQLVMDQLAAAQREWHIDPSRITLTGLSQGGHGAWVIGARHTDVFAAIAPICGYGDPAAGGVADKLAAAGTPVWAFHGLQDNVVSADGTRSMIEAIQQARESAGSPGPEPRISLFPDANHNSWDRAYRREGLAEWLLAQRRK